MPSNALQAEGNPCVCTQQNRPPQSFPNLTFKRQQRHHLSKTFFVQSSRKTENIPISTLFPCSARGSLLPIFGHRCQTNGSLVDIFRETSTHTPYFFFRAFRVAHGRQVNRGCGCVWGACWQLYLSWSFVSFDSHLLLGLERRDSFKTVRKCFERCKPPV